VKSGAFYCCIVRFGGDSKRKSARSKPGEQALDGPIPDSASLSLVIDGQQKDSIALYVQVCDESEPAALTLALVSSAKADLVVLHA
jgi:hypothetical protein